MQNSTIRFNGLNYNVTKARGVIQLANAIKGNRKRAASAFNAAVPVALAYASIEKDCNLDPINALIAAATATEKRNLIAYAESAAPFMSYDKGVFSYTESGVEAAAARVLAVALPEAFDLKAEAEAIKAAAATPEGIADAEAAAVNKAQQLTPEAALKEATKATKALAKAAADIKTLLHVDIGDAARDHLQAALLNLLPLINTNVLAARIGADVDLKAAVNARLEAEAAAAKAAEDRKAAVIEAARISAEAAAAKAAAEAAKAAAYMEEKQAALKAEAEAEAAAKAADYERLTAAAVAKMDAQKRGAALNELDHLLAAGLISATKAEAARKKIAAAAAKAAA